ncbi:kinase-like domain-containing protein [Diplogelasinospora grovesii]|uniref:EKC/KEOPS complex subunit BUD32 n=1 Tax=Diplogelasinospora grovesii TaxID=303347 RepID=A0AAN6S6I8_9PEZI|nr:kinase-like domain-containing protein [Diplogelasinospora grovesii]
MSEPQSPAYPKAYESDEVMDSDDDIPEVNGPSIRHRPHPPATSQGTYSFSVSGEIEELERYDKGGYHPVNLGDRLGDGAAGGRYRVLHKLGYGGFSTVWLCRDTQDHRYVAVKVFAGYASRDNKRVSEADLLAHLPNNSSQPGAEYIARPLDHFSLQGPNGTHQCIVLPVLGPRVSPSLWHEMETENDCGVILKKMCRQATLGLSFLHENGICHGDFRPANILVNVDAEKLNRLSEDELYGLLGPPWVAEVFTESGAEVPDSTPKDLIYPADLWKLRKFLTEEIRIVDFSESFLMSSPPPNLGTPENYLPPEVLIWNLELEKELASRTDDDGAGILSTAAAMAGNCPVGPACDIWALGCTLFAIRNQVALLYMIPEGDEMIAEMVEHFGKLPAQLWAKWDARAEYFDEDDDGTIIPRTGQEDDVTDDEGTIDPRTGQADDGCEKEGRLEHALNDKHQIFKMYGSNPIKEFSIPKDEQKVLGDLLYKICVYNPEKRPTVQEILSHEYFRT